MSRISTSCSRTTSCSSRQHQRTHQNMTHAKRKKSTCTDTQKETPSPWCIALTQVHAVLVQDRYQVMDPFRPDGPGLRGLKDRVQSARSTHRSTLHRSAKRQSMDQFNNSNIWATCCPTARCRSTTTSRTDSLSK